MFTIEQILEASSKVKSGADFPQLIQDLKSIGVIQYENKVSTGQTKYYGLHNFELISEPKYPEQPINKVASADKLRQALHHHQNGKTDYITFCNQAADAGVEIWLTHLQQMTVSYLDADGNNLVIEAIPYL